MGLLVGGASFRVSTLDLGFDHELDSRAIEPGPA
jgi:hypothetical protein